MRRAWALAVLVLLGATISGGLTNTVRAGAQESGSTVVGPDQIDQCIGTEPIGVNPPPTCTFDANGHLISRSQPQTPTDSTSSFPNLGPILFLMLLWSVVPFVIAISLARSRGEPVSSAVLLILVLGWVGLLIVVYGQRRTVADVGRLVHAPAPAASAVQPSAVQPSASTADRLRTIDDLHAQGLITDEERNHRRSAILDTL